MAKVSLLHHIQRVEYAAEWDCLREGKSLPKKFSLHKLSPFIGEDGLMRIKGRLQLSSLSYDGKHCIILPKGHVAEQLIRFHHNLMKHAGVSTLLTTLSRTYYIVGVRRLAKKVKRECINCQRVDSKACNETIAPLPARRVSEAPPFSVTGIDFAGPLFCVDHPKCKFYVCLFTCGVIRAVHLELCSSLSLPDFMLALRRFSARRGVPATIYSDNAATFVGAQAQLQAYFGTLSPKWVNSVPLAPWWGGFWERLVRSVKSALKKCLGSRCLTRTELETTLLEVEAAVNSRPLTFVSNELDYPTPLTPNHFILGRASGLESITIEGPVEMSREGLLERQKVRLECLDRFWEVWRTDYLSSLPTTSAKMSKHGSLQLGSMVLMREENVPRMQWPMGIIIKLYSSKDGIVRSADVKTTRGIRTRAIQRLHNLEVVSEPCPPAEQPPISLVEDPIPLNEVPPARTRSGRVVRRPTHLQSFC